MSTIESQHSSHSLGCSRQRPPPEEFLVPFFLIDREGEGQGQSFANTLGGSVLDRWQRWRMSRPDTSEKTHVGTEFVSQSE